MLYCGTKAGLPSVIVEHAFLSNEGDYRNFLSTNDCLLGKDNGIDSRVHNKVNHGTAEDSDKYRNFEEKKDQHHNCR